MLKDCCSFFGGFFFSRLLLFRNSLWLFASLCGCFVFRCLIFTAFAAILFLFVVVVFVATWRHVLRLLIILHLLGCFVSLCGRFFLYCGCCVSALCFVIFFHLFCGHFASLWLFCVRYFASFVVVCCYAASLTGCFVASLLSFFKKHFCN